MRAVYRIYVFFFGRRIFAKFNRGLFHLGLRGLGILNYEGLSSGEGWFIRRVVASDCEMVVFDVGANVGSFAAEILEFCKSAKVYAFEPHPLNYAQLVKIRKIEAHNLALGSKESSIELFDYAGMTDGSQHASLYREVIEDIHKGVSTAHKIRCVRLDDFCLERGIETIDFLKIDTEGNEFEVLLGAEQMLKAGKIKIIQFEFNEMNLVSRVYMRDFVRLLNGYVLYRLLPSGLLPLNYSPLGCEIFAFQNIVAISSSAKVKGLPTF